MPLLAGMIGALAGACGAPVTTLEVEPAEVTLRTQGEQRKLKATPKDATGALAVDALLEVRWESSSPGVATVVNGVIVGHRSGEAIVTARVGDVRGEARVRVAVPARITLERPEVEIAGVGRTARLAPVVVDDAGQVMAEPLVAYATSSATVATVSPTGVVEAQSPGSAVVTVRVQSLEAKVTVRVRHPEVARLELSLGAAELKRSGDSVRLTATPFDGSGEPVKGVETAWATSNERVATVSADGIVTAVKRGRVRITATVRGQTAYAIIAVLD